jgi:hypothetical protein
MEVWSGQKLNETSRDGEIWPNPVALLADVVCTQKICLESDMGWRSKCINGLIKRQSLFCDGSAIWERLCNCRSFVAKAARPFSTIDIYGLNPTRPSQQGCQMVYFQTKNQNLCNFWRVLQWKMVVYLNKIWSVLQPFGIFIYNWYILW